MADDPQLHVAFFSGLNFSWETRKRMEFLTRNEKKMRKILLYKERGNCIGNLGLTIFLTGKIMSILFFIFYMLYKSGLCLKEFGTLKNHTKSAKIMSKMKKLISHFSYLNFSWEISCMEIPRFLVSHEELRRVLHT